MTDTIIIHEASANAGLASTQLSKGVYEVCLINPGLGSSGYYSPEVLKESGPKAFPTNTKSFVDHATEEERWNRPARSVLDILGVITGDAYWKDEGFQGPGLYGKLTVRPSLIQLVDEIKGYVGMSISAQAVSEWGDMPNGEQAPIIQELIAFPFNSVDIVTVAGRGGAIGEATESADFTYLREHGFAVPSTATPKAKETKATPSKGPEMDFTPEQMQALSSLAAAAPAIIAEAAASAKSREEAAARVAEASKVNPLDTVAALTTALAESGLTVESQKDVVLDLKGGMALEAAIGRWKAIEARTKPADGQPVFVGGVITESGASAVKPAGAPKTLQESLAALQGSYQISGVRA